MKTISIEKQEALSHQELLQLVDYDPETGFMTWKKKRKGAPPGGHVGTVRQSGYRWTTVNFRQYAVHRLVWFYMTGEWPPAQVDHLNRVKTDNRFANLRLASATENCHNKPPGAGIYQRRRKWVAQIFRNAKRVHLGTHATQEEAHKAYLTAKMVLAPLE